MLTLLLWSQLFAFPITNAYAQQVKQNVVVSVTYTEVLPVTACTFIYELADEEMVSPVDSHCWKPVSPVGDFDTWTNLRLDMVNFEVLVKYTDGQVVKIYLTTKINT